MDAHPSRLPLEDLLGARLDGAECLFDPELHDGPDPLTTVENPDARAAREDVAKEICASCPVRDACMEYATRVGPDRGVWAGLTAEEISTRATWQGLLTAGMPRAGKSGALTRYLADLVTDDRYEFSSVDKDVA